MILRNIAIRHGRKALAAPLRTSFLRKLSTGTETLVQDTEAIAHSIENHSKETHSIEANINQLHITQRFVAPALEEEDDEVLADHNLRRTVKKQTHHLGSVVAGHYEPSQLLLNPPRIQDLTLELLMASQSHLGHHTSVWNPMNQKYIFGVRDGIHIISLEETAAHLRRAAKIVEGVAYAGGLILFVGNRKGHAPAMVKAAKMAGGCHLFDRWLAGTITNGNQILRKCAIRAIDKDDKHVDGFQDKIREWRSLKPDLVVCMNPIENFLLLRECGENNIPTIGVVDTDADPTWLTYPIPANDDSIRCIQVIAGVLGRAGEDGQKRRLEEAKKDHVTWQPPVGLGKPMTDEDRRMAAEKRKLLRSKKDERDDRNQGGARRKSAGRTRPDEW